MSFFACRDKSNGTAPDAVAARQPGPGRTRLASVGSASRFDNVSLFEGCIDRCYEIGYQFNTLFACSRKQGQSKSHAISSWSKIYNLVFPVAIGGDASRLFREG
jgi:hypothetical protein